MNRPLQRARPLSVVPLAGLLVALAVAAPPAAFAQSSQADLMKMNAQMTDSASSAAMIPQLRSFIVSAADSTYAGAMRQMLLRALISSHASPRQIAAAADSMAPYLPAQSDRRAAFYASVAQALSDRGAELPKALGFARRAMRELPADLGDSGALRPYVIENLGYAHFKSGNADSAIAYFTMALPTSPDSQRVLILIGSAYQKKGKLDAAIDTYVRSLAVFPGRDTTGLGELRAAYLKRYHTVQGLDARLAAARRTSREKVALEPRRHERPAPAWALNDLDGNLVESSSLAGKIVVMDFWGSWCGPCRMELPLFEALYEHYRGNDRIRFIGVNWERDRERHAELARDYVKNNNINFPVVIDPDQKAVSQYGIQGFPTVFLIDANGQIRYRNVGLAQDIEDILEAQLQSLLE